jgi:large subunit ribosomal protein L15
LHQRVPKRGFTNRFRQTYAILNVGDLNRFEPGAKVTPGLLQEAGVVKNLRGGLKVLGDGVLSKPLNVCAHKFSRQALDKIVAAGGTVEVIGG